MESIFELKKDAIERHIPIILDDTLETITRYVHKREEDGIYVNRILDTKTREREAKRAERAAE